MQLPQFPSKGDLIEVLAYGENRHQKHAALYRAPGSKGDPLAIEMFCRVEGEGPSRINRSDLSGSLDTIVRIAAVFERNWKRVPFIVVIIKHGEPVAVGVSFDSPDIAMKRAVLSEPDAIFGGCVVANFPVGGEHARILREERVPKELLRAGRKRIFDVVIASGFIETARKDLARKNGRCRMYENPALLDLSEKSIDRSPRVEQVRGGFIVEDANTYVYEIPEWVRRRTAGLSHYDLATAFAVAGTMKSNAVAIVDQGILLGRGAAAGSRVEAVEQALRGAEKHHKHLLHRAVAWSDSFFPFPDAFLALVDAGIKLIFATANPNSKERNDEMLALAKERRVLLVLEPDEIARMFSGH